MQPSRIKSEQTRFANKYDYDRAVGYFYRYYKSPRKRLINWFEQKMAKRALAAAGYPTKILDIPCGTGRFWEVLKHNPSTKLYVSDFNIAMLEVGLEKRSADLTSNMDASIASAFNLPFPNDSFESIFCMRFIHHINNPDDRLQLLRELARVTADTVCISAWVEKTGYKGENRLKKQAFRDPQKEYNKFMLPHELLLQEFETAGFELVNYTDLLPHVSVWRLYVLRKKRNARLTKPVVIEYICPLCKGTLHKREGYDQLVCERETIAYPIKGHIPMLTQRDAINLIQENDKP
ncbi:MAG: methyltransferase domain-containing protein [Legionellales bacterium]|nr:methyltransferase domain-containing protein [Legionellales bacterium]